nr:hypothetical protein [Tanacetum cinerariifolium]
MSSIPTNSYLAAFVFGIDVVYFFSEFDYFRYLRSLLKKYSEAMNVIEISSDKGEGHGDWNSPEIQDTTNSGGKKEAKAMVFHKMETEEISDIFVAPFFINGLEAYDGEINLGVKENMISNEFAVKLYLEHEFIINPDEDDVEPDVVFGRSFLHLTKAIADFGNETITLLPELDPFLVSSNEEKIDDDWDMLLDDLDFGDILDIEGVDVL